MSCDLPKKHRRRWLRYSLRTWLVVMTVVAVCGGWWCLSVMRQREAVEKMQAAGFVVRYDFEWDNVRRNPECPVPKFLRSLLGVNSYHNVVEFQLPHDPYLREHVNVAAVRNVLSSLPHLKSLGLRGPASDADLCLIGRLTDLEFLGLDELVATDKGNEKLAHLRNLKWLELCGPLTDGNVRAISRLPRLEWLTIFDVELSHHMMAEIGSMTQLISLDLLDCRGISDINYLSNMKQLRHLGMREANPKAQMPNLRQFEAAMPNCDIEYDLGDRRLYEKHLPE